MACAGTFKVGLKATVKLVLCPEESVVTEGGVNTKADEPLMLKLPRVSGAMPVLRMTNTPNGDAPQAPLPKYVKSAAWGVESPAMMPRPFPSNATSGVLSMGSETNTPASAPMSTGVSR